MKKRRNIYCSNPHKRDKRKTLRFHQGEQRKRASILTATARNVYPLRKKTFGFLQWLAAINLGGLWSVELERRRLEKIPRGKWSLLVASRRSYCRVNTFKDCTTVKNLAIAARRKLTDYIINVIREMTKLIYLKNQFFINELFRKSFFTLQHCWTIIKTFIYLTFEINKRKKL